MPSTRDPNGNAQVVFVCLHGSAKSVIAAAQFRNLVAALGLNVDVAALGTEPDPTFPQHVLEGLKQDGLTSHVPAPQLATAKSLRGAHLVISFGPEVLHLLPDHCRLRMWSDVPAVADGYTQASGEIYKRVALLVDELLRSGGPPNG